MTSYTFIFKKGNTQTKKYFLCASESEAWSEADQWAYNNGFEDFWRV